MTPMLIMHITGNEPSNNVKCLYYQHPLVNLKLGLRINDYFAVSFQSSGSDVWHTTFTLTENANTSTWAVSFTAAKTGTHYQLVPSTIRIGTQQFTSAEPTEYILLCVWNRHRLISLLHLLTYACNQDLVVVCMTEVIIVALCHSTRAHFSCMHGLMM